MERWDQNNEHHQSPTALRNARKSSENNSHSTYRYLKSITWAVFLAIILGALLTRNNTNNMSHYNNTCLGITSQATPDPFVTYARGKFYFTFTAGNRVPLWEADKITDFWEEGNFKKGPVWLAVPFL